MFWYGRFRRGYYWKSITCPLYFTETCRLRQTEETLDYKDTSPGYREQLDRTFLSVCVGSECRSLAAQCNPLDENNLKSDLKKLNVRYWYPWHLIALIASKWNRTFFSPTWNGSTNKSNYLLKQPCRSFWHSMKIKDVSVLTRVLAPGDTSLSEMCFGTATKTHNEPQMQMLSQKWTKMWKGSGRRCNSFSP